MRHCLCFLLTMGIYSISFGQGCSDAGFCTMGAMRPSQVYTKKINFKLKSLEFGYYRGKTTLSPVVNDAIVDFTFGVTEKTNLQVKLPYQWVSGNLGETSGLADISLSVTHNLKTEENYHINGTIGFKIPTNNADLDEDVKGEFITDGYEGPTDLPMYYQTSLGTFDLVLGGSYINREWMFAAGLQAPLIHNNENEFSYDAWQNYTDVEGYLMAHPLATHLKRGTDVMVRAERAFHFSNLDIRLGILPIFRVTKDKIEDPDTGEEIKVDGTTGMALTTLLNVAYHFNTYNSIKLMYGQKITDRDVNPDGLTRHNVVTTSYVIRF